MTSIFQGLFLENIKPILEKNYFQPLELLDGKTICSLDIDYKQIKKPYHFETFLKDNGLKNFEYLKGSILEDIIDLDESVDLVVNNLDLDKYFELKYDFVN